MIGEYGLCSKDYAAMVFLRVLVALGCGELYDMYTTSKFSILVVTFALNVFNNVSCTRILRIQLAISLSINTK